MYFQYIHLPVWQLPVPVFCVQAGMLRIKQKIYASDAFILQVL